MEILVISHKYPPSIGGMQKQCYELVSHLKKSNSVHELIYKGKGSNIVFLFTAAIKALLILKKNPRIELIYTNDGLMTFFVTPLFWLTKTTIIPTIHGLDVVFPLKFYQRWVKKYLNRCGAVIAVSEPTGLELVERGVDEQLVHVVKNGFEPKNQLTKNANAEFLKKRLGINLDRKKVIVSIGRSVERKGFSWFIKNIFPALEEEVIYLIIGPSIGNHEEVLRSQSRLPKGLRKLLNLLNGTPLDELAVHNLIKENNYGNRVFHLSNLSNNELQAALTSADLYVMPNLKVEGDYEGFGLVALEAIQAGLLVLAADVDGIPSAVENGKNGILLESGNTNQWILTIEKLLSDDKARKKLASTYYKNSQSLHDNWAEMSAKYEAVFRGRLRDNTDSQ